MSCPATDSALSTTVSCLLTKLSLQGEVTGFPVFRMQDLPSSLFPDVRRDDWDGALQNGDRSEADCVGAALVEGCC